MSAATATGRGGFPARATDGDFPEIRRLLDAIHAWNIASEAVYLDVGEDIQSLHRKVSEVRDAIKRSTDVFATPEMAEMREGLATAAEETRVVSGLAGERAEALERLRAAVDIAGAGSTAVLLVFRLLDYVVLIARAQVEGMSDGQDELGPFTAHVDDLVSVGEGVSREIDERMQLLDRHLGASRQIENVTDLDGSSMIEDFMGLAAQLTAQQAASAAVREEAHAAFTEVWKAIGGIVAGLQFHDMARQRLEHTIANLNRMRAVLSTGLVSDGGTPIEPALRPVAVRRIALLEIAQLDDLARLYEDKMAELDGYLGSIGGQMEESRAILGRLPGGGGAKGAKGARKASTLDAQAEQLSAHFRLGAETRLKLGTSLDRCIEATDQLLAMTEKLDDLEHELKIAGVNAAVHAAHVEGGDDTIGYIARVICEQATIARSEADRVRQGIDLAVKETADLATRILPDIAAGETAIEGRLGGATAALSLAEAAYGREIATANDVAHALGGDVVAVRDKMTPHLEGCRLMGALAAALAAIAADLGEEEASDEAMADLDAQLAGHYTMAEERAIFASVIGSAAFAPPPLADFGAPAPAPGSDEDLDDILF